MSRRKPHEILTLHSAGVKHADNGQPWRLRLRSAKDNPCKSTAAVLHAGALPEQSARSPLPSDAASDFGACRPNVMMPANDSKTEDGMDETTIDREAMGQLAKALAFICGPDHPTTIALKAAAESGAERDIKSARTLFLRLKPSDRRAALAMINE